MAGDVAPETPATGDVVKPKRVSATVLDMVRSLGLLAVVVAVTLVFVPGLLHPSKSQRFPAASYSDDVGGFKQVTGMDAPVPNGLSAGWYANSARLTYRGTYAHLYIGWVTPDSNYLALDESNGSVTDLAAAVLKVTGARQVGQATIAGAAWARYATPGGGDTAIARTIDGVTVVISGSGSTAQQSELAAALQSSASGAASS